MGDGVDPIAGVATLTLPASDPQQLVFDAYLDTGSAYAADLENPVPFFDAREYATRLWGELQAVGGVVEAATGAGLVVAGGATSEAGIGIPIAAGGYVTMVHGADSTAAGIATLISGERTDTLTSKALQLAGLNGRRPILPMPGSASCVHWVPARRCAMAARRQPWTISLMPGTA